MNRPPPTNENCCQIIHISYQKVYKFKGWLFEYDHNKPITPWSLKKDLELRKRAGTKFFNLFYEFSNLTIDEQEKHRY